MDFPPPHSLSLLQPRWLQRRLWQGIVLALPLLAAIPAFAAGPGGLPPDGAAQCQEGPDGHDGPPPRDMHEVAPALSGMPWRLGAIDVADVPYWHGVVLTDAQQEQVYALDLAQASYLHQQGRAAAQAGAALHALGLAERYDDAQAMALAQAAAQAIANIALQQARSDQKILALLTPEQRKQLASTPLHHPPRPPVSCAMAHQAP